MKHTNQTNAVAAARARRVVSNPRKAAVRMPRALTGLWPQPSRLCAFGDTETPFYLNMIRPSDRVLNRSKPFVPLLQRNSPT